MSEIIKNLPDVRKRTVERYLQKLRDSNVIEFRGAPKTGGYYVFIPKSIE